MKRKKRIILVIPTKVIEPVAKVTMQLVKPTTAIKISLYHML
jgi:hypothetical protein